MNYSRTHNMLDINKLVDIENNLYDYSGIFVNSIEGLFIVSILYKKTNILLFNNILNIDSNLQYYLKYKLILEMCKNRHNISLSKNEGIEGEDILELMNDLNKMVIKVKCLNVNENFIQNIIYQINNDGGLKT